MSWVYAVEVDARNGWLYVTQENLEHQPGPLSFTGPTLPLLPALCTLWLSKK